MLTATHTNAPQPFVKWVGGKRRVLGSFDPFLPDAIGTYWEPFVGGGALFFHLASQARFTRAHLSDVNQELIAAWQAVQESPDKLIKRLREHQKQHSKEHYYMVRESGFCRNHFEVGARVIYLNKTCFNGLWRVNRSGKFNVPMGSYEEPNILDSKNIRACHRALKNVAIACKSFSKIKPRPGDFVYADPPYDETFNGYVANGFGDQGQRDLFDSAREWNEHGAKVMISNADTDTVKELYGSNPSFHIDFISAPRAINRNGDGRKPVREVVIRNYRNPHEVDGSKGATP